MLLHFKQNENNPIFKVQKSKMNYGKDKLVKLFFNLKKD